MFTGEYQSRVERTENVIINFSLMLTLVLLVLKLTGLASLAIWQVLLPIVVPPVLLLMTVVLARLGLWVGLKIYNLGEKLQLLLSKIR